jgi:hypothetical protein
MFMRMKGWSRDVGGGNWCEMLRSLSGLLYGCLLVGILHLELPKSDWFWDLIWDIIMSG